MTFWMHATIHNCKFPSRFTATLSRQSQAVATSMLLISKATLYGVFLCQEAPSQRTLWIFPSMWLTMWLNIPWKCKLCFSNRALVEPICEALKCLTLWHEIITKIIPWELFFVIFEGFCALEMSRKEIQFQGITREIRNFPKIIVSD